MAGASPTVYVKWIVLTALLSACLVTIPTPAAAQCNQNPDITIAPDAYQVRADLVARWIVQDNQLPSGAFLMNNADKPRIVPYFANHAAWGLVPYKKYSKEIRAYLDWYFTHLNKPDRFGRSGTVYDYEVHDGQEVSTNDYDSADAYAGTFLTLIRAWYESDPAASRDYLISHRADLELIAQVITGLQQKDGLTWAKDNYRIKYLLDNAEAYAGLRDLATIGGDLGIAPQTIDRLRKSANAVQDGINRRLWDMERNNYRVGLQDNGQVIRADLTVWYPDAIAQLALIMNEVPTRVQYTSIYARFVRAQPKWFARDDKGNFNRKGYTEVPEYPFVLVAYAARLLGQVNDWTTFSDSIVTEYLSGPNAFHWPWNTGDAGIYLLLNAPTQRVVTAGRGTDC